MVNWSPVPSLFLTSCGNDKAEGQRFTKSMTSKELETKFAVKVYKDGLSQVQFWVWIWLCFLACFLKTYLSPLRWRLRHIQNESAHFSSDNSESWEFSSNIIQLEPEDLLSLEPGIPRRLALPHCPVVRGSYWLLNWGLGNEGEKAVECDEQGRRSNYQCHSSSSVCALMGGES